MLIVAVVFIFAFLEANSFELRRKFVVVIKFRVLFSDPLQVLVVSLVSGHEISLAEVERKLWFGKHCLLILYSAANPLSLRIVYVTDFVKTML